MIIHPTGYWSGDHLGHAYDPGLAQWIAVELSLEDPAPVIDFGCGDGYYLRELKAAGLTELRGYEGRIPKSRVFDPIVEQDLTVPFTCDTKGHVLCLEVAEHVPREHEVSFLGNITTPCTGTLILSWAVPGQVGDGHVNCRTNEEASVLVEFFGFEFDAKATADGRSSVTTLPWFRNTLLVFRRTTFE